LACPVYSAINKKSHRKSTLKQKRFEFTPEAVACNVLVAQVDRKTVPNTWPGDSEAPVAECVNVCMEWHTICRWKSIAIVEDLPRPDVCRWQGDSQEDRLLIRYHGM